MKSCRTVLRCLSFPVGRTPTLFMGISFSNPKIFVFFIRRITLKGWVQSTGLVRIVGGCPCIWCFEYLANPCS